MEAEPDIQVIGEAGTASSALSRERIQRRPILGDLINEYERVA